MLSNRGIALCAALAAMLGLAVGDLRAAGRSGRGSGGSSGVTSRRGSDGKRASGQGSGNQSGRSGQQRGGQNAGSQARGGRASQGSRGQQQGAGVGAQAQADTRTRTRTRTREGDQGSGRQSRWQYNRAEETSLRGSVIEGPAGGKGAGLAATLRVQAGDGAEQRVQLGPPWHLADLGLRPAPGDQVQVTGAPGGQGKGEMVARQVNWNGNTYRLRTREGAPLWAGASRPGWGAYAGAWDDSAFEETTGTIDAIETTSPGGDMGRGVAVRLRSREGEGAQLRTRERRRVHLGPYWFVEDNMPGLAPGQEITVRGARVMVGGEQATMAGEIVRKQERLRLRSGQGKPDWPGGWRNWDGWGPGSRYTRMYDPDAVETVTGRVERASNGIPTAGMGQGLMLSLRTQQQSRLRAHVAPSWFAEQSDLDIQPGDRVTLSGSVVPMNSKRVMMVRTLTRGQRQITLREEDGAPVWSGLAPGQTETPE